MSTLFKPRPYIITKSPVCNCRVDVLPSGFTIRSSFETALVCAKQCAAARDAFSEMAKRNGLPLVFMKDSIDQ